MFDDERDHPVNRHLAAGSAIGRSLVLDLVWRAGEFRRADDDVHIQAARLHPVVVAERDTVARLLTDGRCTETVRNRILSLVGELSQLAGWTAFDSGQYAAAQMQYLAGVQAADEAGDASVLADLWSSLAYMQADTAEPTAAMNIARRAHQIAARSAHPLVAAITADRLAWCAALSSHNRECAAALDAADAMFAVSRGDLDGPSWLYWLSAAEINVMRARCLTVTGRPQQAVGLLEATLFTYPTNQVREVCLYAGWLAAAWDAAGIPEAATFHRQRAISIARKEGVVSAQVDARLGM
jgi:hypothetical protein